VEAPQTTRVTVAPLLPLRNPRNPLFNALFSVAAESRVTVHESKAAPITRELYDRGLLNSDTEFRRITGQTAEMRYWSISLAGAGFIHNLFSFLLEIIIFNPWVTPAAHSKAILKLVETIF
jgi:hypothetical protein